MAQEELDGPCIRQTAIPLEARGVTAAFDTAANRFTIFEELTYDAAGQLLTASFHGAGYPNPASGAHGDALSVSIQRGQRCLSA